MLNRDIFEDFCTEVANIKGCDVYGNYNNFLDTNNLPYVELGIACKDTLNAVYKLIKKYNYNITKEHDCEGSDYPSYCIWFNQSPTFSLNFIEELTNENGFVLKDGKFVRSKGSTAWHEIITISNFIDGCCKVEYDIIDWDGEHDEIEYKDSKVVAITEVIDFVKNNIRERKF